MSAAKKQNIILILADDLGYEALGCYGGTSYKTPNLDRMAAGGVRFTHAYSLPLCTPTRCQLMTGKYNFRNWKAFGVLDPQERTFGHYMQDAGYATCITGKWQLWSYNPPDFEPEWRGKGMLPEDSGFDEYFLWHAGHTEDKGSRYADPVILDNGEMMPDTEGLYGPDLFTGYLLDFASRHKDEPFFIYYPMALTHGPFMPTPNSPGWDEDRHKNDVSNFGDMVEYTDTLIGHILDGLDELGLADDTLVMFIGDNGSPREVTSMLGERPFQGGKGHTTDAGTRVPFVCKWGDRAAGTVCKDLVDCSDFLPTMFQLARVSPPEGEIFDGRSFLPQLCGEEGDPRDYIYAWHNPLPGHGKTQYRLQEWAQDQRWKLYDDGRFYDLAADDLEENPLTGRLEDEAASDARDKLESVLDHYKQQQGRMSGINAGVVGYGYSGRAFQCYLIGLADGLDLHAISTRDPERQTAARSDHPDAKVYGDLDDLLRDDDVQLVVIATPHDTHRDLAIRAMDAGKHVVVDKVMCMNVAEADDMIAARDRNDVMLSVFHNRRWDWDYLTVRKAIDDGLLGDPYLFQVAIMRYGGPRGWRGEKSASGGILYDWPAHFVDQAMLLGRGRAEQVYCDVVYRDRWPIDIGNYGTIHIRFDSGVRYQIEIGNLAAVNKPRWYVAGDLGTLVKTGLDPQEGPMREGRIEAAEEDPSDRAQVVTHAHGDREAHVLESVRGSWTRYYQNISDVLNKDAELIVTPEQAREGLRVFDAAMRSAESGQIVGL